MSYYRSKERNKRLKKLYDENKTFISPVYYDKKKKRLIKIYKTPSWKYLKRKANKRVRRCNICLHNSDYKKLFDITFNYW